MPRLAGSTMTQALALSTRRVTIRYTLVYSACLPVKATTKNRGKEKNDVQFVTQISTNTASPPDALSASLAGKFTGRLAAHENPTAGMAPRAGAPDVTERSQRPGQPVAGRGAAMASGGRTAGGRARGRGPPDPAGAGGAPRPGARRAGCLAHRSRVGQPIARPDLAGKAHQTTAPAGAGPVDPPHGLPGAGLAGPDRRPPAGPARR